MYLYTIGFTQKSAQQFFEPMKFYGIQMLVDVRLKNDSQLSGFTRKRDLPYILGLIGCKYEHCVNYAPTQEILTAWRKKLISWEEYTTQYRSLMINRKAVYDFITRYDSIYEAICLLCSEPTPEHCHRRLFAEMLHAQRPDIEILHI